MALTPHHHSRRARCPQRSTPAVLDFVRAQGAYGIAAAFLCVNGHAWTVTIPTQTTMAGR